MSKGLEALEKLYEEREYLLGDKVNHKTKNWHNDITHYDNINKCLLTIKQDLDRLEAIDNANPSEALEFVYCLKDYLMNMMPYYDWLNDIEKYILKAQEQEKKLKALEIVDKKRVNVHKFKWCVFKKYYVNYYNLHFCDEDDQFLNEHEFDLLKEVFCNDISNRS